MNGSHEIKGQVLERRELELALVQKYIDLLNDYLNKNSKTKSIN